MNITQAQRDAGFEAASAALAGLNAHVLAAIYSNAITADPTCAAHYAAYSDPRMWTLRPESEHGYAVLMGWNVVDRRMLDQMPLSGFELVRRAMAKDPRFPCHRSNQGAAFCDGVRAGMNHTIDTELAVRKAMASHHLYTHTKVAEALELPHRLGARGAGEARDLQRLIGTFVSPLLAPRLLPAL